MTDAVCLCGQPLEPGQRECAECRDAGDNDRFPTWEEPGTCLSPDCENARKPGRKLCPEHARLADEAAEQDAAAWTSLESADA